MKTRVVVQASIHDERDLDRVADALNIQHPRIHLRESQKRVKEKRQRRSSNVETNSNTLWFRGKGKGKNTVTSENLEQVPITRATLPLKIAIMMTTRLNPQMPIKHTTIRLTHGSDDGEEPLDDDAGDEENDKFSPYVPLDDVTVFRGS